MQPSYDITLEDQIREFYGRVIYTHKTHESMAERASCKLGTYKIAQIVLTAFTSSGAVGILLIDEFWLKFGTAAVSFLTLFMSAYMKNFDLGGIAQAHREMASKLWNVRECYLSLLTDLPTMHRDEAVAQRDELQTMLAALYQSAPQTNRKAYKEAQDRLKKMEDMTFAEQEIDHFLPLSLKRSGGRPLPAKTKC
jgi:hypothetical protein